jgi:hypothetical protein
MYQGEQCYLHWQNTGDFHIPDGIDAVIRSRQQSSEPGDTRRLTYVLFPDGSEVSISIYRLLGQEAVRMAWCHDPHEDWPTVVTPNGQQGYPTVYCSACFVETDPAITFSEAHSRWRKQYAAVEKIEGDL